ncbi:MAG: carbohydrate ABC transporter permease [Oscillospiraceae bacterium]
MVKKKSALRHPIAFWAFVAPCLVLFAIFFLIPLGMNIYFSFTNYDGWKTLDWVGLSNYVKLFQDKNFYNALLRTFGYTLFSLPFKVIVPLVIAVLVCSPKVRFKSLTRTVIYIPVLLSALVVGITINWMFSQEYGLVNFLIQVFGRQPLQWALNSNLATFVISFASNWASTGFYMVIFIGGINNISPDLYEASAIDGASDLQAFWRITLPMLRPTTFLVTLLSTVNLLKEYALVQGITQGGPGKNTTYIVQYIFEKGFDQAQYGYGTAISTVVMFVFIVIAAVQFQVNNKGGEN